MEPVQPTTKQIFWKYQNVYTVTLRIKPGKDFLAVFVKKTKPRNIYSQDVTNQFIKASTTLQHFTDYSDLYDYLSKNSKDVTFVSDPTTAYLQFLFQGKKNFIELVPKVRSNFPEVQDSQFQAKLKEQKDDLQKQIKESADNQQAQIKQTNNKIDDLKEKGQTFKEQITERQEVDQAAIAQIQRNMRNLPMLPAFYNNPGNTLMFFFTVATTGPNTARLVHQAVSQQLYNFVNGVQITPNKKVRYTAKAINIQAFAPMVGFCTSAGFGQIGNQKKQESAYYSYNGTVYKEGALTDNFPKAGVADLIEIDLDYKKGQITWWKNKAEITSIKIPDGMSGKTLYLSVLMWQKGDQIDLGVVPAPA